MAAADSGGVVRNGWRRRLERRSLVRIATFLIAACLVTSSCGADPVKSDGAQGSFCSNWSPGRTYTIAADYLKVSKPATIVSVKAVGAHNLVIVDAVLVPMLDKDGAVGTGEGLPTDNHAYAGSLAPRSWKAREFLPAKVTPAHQWQLVFGLRVLRPASALVNGATAVVASGGNHWAFHSQLYFGVGAPGKGSSCPGLAGTS